MRVKFVWDNEYGKWSVYKVTGYLWIKGIEWIGTIDAPKGAHFNTLVDEYNKKYKVHEGRI